MKQNPKTVSESQLETENGNGRVGKEDPCSNQQRKSNLEDEKSLETTPKRSERLGPKRS